MYQKGWPNSWPNFGPPQKFYRSNFEIAFALAWRPLWWFCKPVIGLKKAWDKIRWLGQAFVSFAVRKFWQIFNLAWRPSNLPNPVEKLNIQKFLLKHSFFVRFTEPISEFCRRRHSSSLTWIETMYNPFCVFSSLF